jgi:hypothetical protein
VDAGTRDTFQKVRGVDQMDNVVKTLRRYAAKGKVQSKYIVYDLNCDLREMSRYIKLMASIGIREIILTLHAWVGVKDEYIDCIALGKFLAQRAKINVSVNDHVAGGSLVQTVALADEVIAKNTMSFLNILEKELPDIYDRIKPKNMKTRMASPTPGHIDIVPAGTGQCEIEGWIANRDTKKPFEKVMVKIGDSFYETDAFKPRPDVAGSFNEPRYANSGFSAWLLPLAPGEHTIEIIGIAENGKWYSAEHKAVVFV